MAVGDAEETQYIAAALQEAELTVDVIAPENLPITAAGLIPYESVILANVAADRLTDRQMQTILAYVRDLGGGLVSLGGPEAYGPGGYFQTPLETVLPVSMQLEDQQRQPQAHHRIRDRPIRLDGDARPQRPTADRTREGGHRPVDRLLTAHRPRWCRHIRQRRLLDRRDSGRRQPRGTAAIGRHAAAQRRHRHPRRPRTRRTRYRQRADAGSSTSSFCRMACRTAPALSRWSARCTRKPVSR
ncbi:MAG: hypothetical protein HND48_01865 [Chloroflexi bacterium]|nr:hypothetical protein [Chloroflexota bacterium]